MLKTYIFMKHFLCIFHVKNFRNWWYNFSHAFEIIKSIQTINLNIQKLTFCLFYYCLFSSSLPGPNHILELRLIQIKQRNTFGNHLWAIFEFFDTLVTIRAQNVEHSFQIRKWFWKFNNGSWKILDNNVQRPQEWSSKMKGQAFAVNNQIDIF